MLRTELCPHPIHLLKVSEGCDGDGEGVKAHRKTRSSLQDLDNEDLNYASKLGEV